MRRALLALPIAVSLFLSACSHTVTGEPVSPPSSSPSSSAPQSPSQSQSSGSSGGTPATPTIAPVTFGSCSQIFSPSDIPVPDSLQGKITYGCATLSVPLDYTRPNGRAISLQLLRIHDTAANPSGSLLLNPGGPGASGLNLALSLVGQLDPSVIQHYDLIGFDPRGVGLSSPVECISDRQKDQLNAFSADIRTATGFAQTKQLAEQVADECSAKYGSALPFFNTVNTARDMDLIRQAVGDPVMNYLGYSYGTELGAAYAHLFPSKVHTFVLDGAVDPLSNPTQALENQVKGFEQAFDQFAANCTTSASACKGLTNPRQTVYDIVKQTSQQPMNTDSSRTLTSNLALTGVLQALYSQQLWPDLASALVDAQRGDGSGLLNLADQYNERNSDGTYSNLIDANDAIACNDSPAGPSDASIRATAARWATEYPMFGLWAASSLFPCQQWQPVRTPPPLPTAPSTAQTVLVIGNLHDPATPYQGTLDLAKTLGKAEVLSWDGEGHTSYLSGSSCVDNTVNRYLIAGTLPPQNTTCPR